MNNVRISYYLVNGQSVSCTVDEDTADEMVHNYESWLRGERFSFAGQRLIGGNGFTIVMYDKVTHINYVILSS